MLAQKIALGYCCDCPRRWSANVMNPARCGYGDVCGGGGGVLCDALRQNPLPPLYTQMMLEKLVSVHVRSRHFPTLEHAGRFITAVVAMYDSYVAMRKMDTQLIAAGLMPAQANT